MSTHKFITVLNKTIDVGQAINAGLHAMNGLSRRIYLEHPDEASDWSDFRDFEDADGVSHPFVSGRSLIVLKGRNTDLHRLRAGLVQSGVSFVDFHRGMTGGTVEEQLDRCRGLHAEDHEYMAIAAVGPRDVIDPLTRKLSLFRG